MSQTIGLPKVDYQKISPSKTGLSVVLISSNEARRRALSYAFERQQAIIARELSGYPSFDQLPRLVESDCDVVVVDLDDDPDVALDLVEAICSKNPATTVIVYAKRQDPDLLVRCMRAGAREFLTEPLSPNSLAEAVIRAGARRLELDAQKRTAGKLLVFRGSRGGAGVTMLAANFAIALKLESKREVALVDLHPELGDVAVMLGLTPEFTISDALQNPDRLDHDLVSKMLTEHKSGIAVLAAADDFTANPVFLDGSLGKLLHLLRTRFPFVVVDAGPGLGTGGNALLEMADVVYLVTQAEIPALRNAQRILAHIQQAVSADRKIEVVLNRFEKNWGELEEGRIEKALGRPLQWKIPNDFASVHRSLNTGNPLAMENSSVSRVLRQMARQASGNPVPSRKKSWAGLFY